MGLEVRVLVASLLSSLAMPAEGSLGSAGTLRNQGTQFSFGFGSEAKTCRAPAAEVPFGKSFAAASV